jgi:hypothetical protein
MSDRAIPVFFASPNILLIGGYMPKNMKCADLKFVPYDTQISPADNLYDNPNDLDTQPEFPLRTDLVFYKQVEQVMEPPLRFEISPEHSGTGRELTMTGEKYPFPPASTMLTLWFMGLALWCVFFMKSSGKRSRRIKGGGIKDV